MLTTREVADALGVSESSLKRWIDAGRIAALRTHGGHRRVALREALRFIHETRAPVARPELLGLPEIDRDRARRGRLSQYLLEGDGAAARGFLAARYLEGMRVAELADGPIRDAMHALGELWHHDEAGVFTEHRGTDLCLQAVNQLRALLAEPSPHAPVAVGGAPSGDPYLLPSMLAAMTVVEAGMHAVNLGPDTPLTAFDAAIKQYRPKLLWISISSIPSAAHVRAFAEWLHGIPRTVMVVVGGQQAQMLERAPPRGARVSSMSQLADLVTERIRAA